MKIPKEEVEHLVFGMLLTIAVFIAGLGLYYIGVHFYNHWVFTIASPCSATVSICDSNPEYVRMHRIEEEEGLRPLCKCQLGERTIYFHP